MDLTFAVNLFIVRLILLNICQEFKYRNKQKDAEKREALNGKIKNRIGKKLNATIENKIVAFVYVLCSLLFLS